MTAQPKKKTSPVRSKTRRAHYKAKLVAVNIDPKTGKASRPHRLDSESGFYAGKKVMLTKTDKRNK